MTPREFLQVVGRRWYVLVALLACTATGLYALPSDAGVYWTRVSVVFLPPVGPETVGNVLEGSDPSLVYFAAAVERSTNGTARNPRLSSSAATLYGTGVRRGHTVSLVDTGGQWRSNFNRPMLVVEVVDTSAAEVSQVTAELVAEIQSRAATLQATAGAGRSTVIGTELSPQEPVVGYVGGHRGRAMAGLLVLGTGLSLAGTVLADAVLARRRRPQAALAL